jgi:hypothetical protein
MNSGYSKKINIDGLNKTKYELKDFFKLLYLWNPHGAHKYRTEARGELGKQMEKLYNMELNVKPDNKKLLKCLDKIRLIRKSHDSLEKWVTDFFSFNDLRCERSKYITLHNRRAKCCDKNIQEIKSLDDLDFWGSERQLKFGCTVMVTLENKWNMDPIFGSLLRPTGGLVGLDNLTLYVGSINDALVMHSIVHDAGGYLYNYHKIGPGYNYLRTGCTCFSTSKPLSNQAAGLTFWEINSIEFYDIKKRWGLLDKKESSSNNDSESE